MRQFGELTKDIEQFRGSRLPYKRKIPNVLYRVYEEF